MSYRHPRWYEYGNTESDIDPRSAKGCFVLALSVTALPLFLLCWHVLAAVGLAELWIPLGCIGFVWLFLHVWFKQ